MDEIEILGKFQKQVVIFLDEMNDLIPDDGDLLTLRVFVQDQISAYDLMNSFITHLYIHKDRVKERDDKFFLSKKDLFSSVKRETVEKFKGYWRGDFFEENDRDMIWKWADLFFRLGDNYIKSKK